MVRWWCSGEFAAPWTWAWTPYVGVWLFMAALAIGHALVVHAEAHASGSRVDRGRLAAFVVAWASLWLVMDWPVGKLAAGYLLTASMVQVVVATYVVAPLFVYAVPSAARTRILDATGMSPIRAIVRRPLVAFLAMNAVLLVTHLPAVADALHARQLGTMLMDLGWLTSALLFWWSLAEYQPGSREARFGLSVVYLLASNAVPMALGVVLVYSEFPLYTTYEFANRAFMGISALEDQQAAGLLMWVGTAPLFFVRLGLAFREAFAEAPAR